MELFVLLISILSFKILKVTGSCSLWKNSTLCFCEDESEMLVACEHGSLEEILKELRAIGRNFKLSVRFNHISHLSQDPFKKLNITSLALNSNNLMSIGDDAFWSLRYNLQSLDLQLNLLEVVPKYAILVLENLHYLNFGYNKISKINSQDFSGLYSLKTLHLESNRITMVDKKAFYGAGLKLKELYLQDNMLKEVPTRSFENVNNLVKLDMSRNFLFQIEDFSFSTLKELESLNLGHNQIHKMSDRAFDGTKKLRVIFMHNNKLSECPSGALEVLQKVEYLVLGENKIQKLKDFSFTNMKSLRTLNLENNEIFGISEKAFKGLEDTLSYLHLQGNDLKYVPSLSLSKLKNLWVLNLGYNSITEVKYQDLTGIRNTLGTLNLEGNMISFVQNSSIFANFSALISLNLKGNEISSLFDNMFNNFSSLEMLNLANNKISYIERNAFSGLENSLKALDLSENLLYSYPYVPVSKLKRLKVLTTDKNKIQIIKSKMFNTISNSSIISLSSNKITSIESKCFDNVSSSYKSIDLSHNKIIYIPKFTFTNCPQIQKIILSNNAIIQLEEDAFVNMPGLRKLNLSHNQIQQISFKMFNGIPNLQILDLSFNKLTMLNALIFRIVPGIQSLDFSNNKLEKVSQHAFAGLTTIKKLSLSHNKLSSLDLNVFNRLIPNLIEESKEILCYGPPHLMNSCILCLPSEAFVCKERASQAVEIERHKSRARNLVNLIVVMGVITSASIIILAYFLYLLKRRTDTNSINMENSGLSITSCKMPLYTTTPKETGMSISDAQPELMTPDAEMENGIAGDELALESIEKGATNTTEASVDV